MRVPLSWLREHLPDLPAEVTGRQVADRLIAVGLEVETVDVVGGELSGPLVAGRITEITELTGFNKPIRFCRVDVGGEHNDADGARGIVCGARNFAAGEAVVVALPGAVLPGAHPGGHREITARKTYGHVSDGMICSEVELGVPGGDASGIIVLPAGTAAGLAALDVLGLPEEVLDIAVTPDRGYALSVRGVAREVAAAFGLGFTDPAATAPRAEPGGHEVRLEDAAGCDRFVARVVTGLDPTRPSPTWLCRRLRLAGMRPLGLAVDVTNFVMLELGQPLHGYDRDLLRGPITVRRAGAGEKLQTLDGVTRDLDSEDLLITDDSGPIGLAGVMGGASTEISATTTAVLIEAAHFDPVSIARGARRHRLPSEASRRFERGVDPALAPAAAQRAVDLLVDLGGGSVEPAGADAGHPRRPGSITIDADLPARVAGRELDPATVTRRLAQIGADTDAIGARITVRVPSWRPDLTDPADLVEEVLRLEGYDSVPSVLPPVPAGRGLTRAQHQRRRIGRALAAAGLVETPCYPFIGDRDLDDLGLGAEDPRRAVLGLANPISEQQPNLRTTLLPGLLGALRRNVGRGNADVALFEIGTVFRPAANAPAAPRPPVDRRATDAELAAAEAALPRQPRRVAAVLAGHREPPGWWGPGRAASWSDALDAARVVAEAAGAELTARADEHPPWHPGRCAALLIAERVVGHAGELHPRCVNALDLPARTVAMELDLDAVAAGAAGGVEAPRISTYPPATRDVALIVETSVPAADVRAALHAGGGPLVESVRLFDVYAGEQVGAGRRSLAFALRFRAPDRTLTAEETTAARDAAIAEATARTGAELRG